MSDNDLIRRGDAKDLAVLAVDDTWEAAYTGDRFDELPAVDAVEVVRCRDCVCFGKHGNCTALKGPLMTSADGYCHFGRRRTDADE